MKLVHTLKNMAGYYNIPVFTPQSALILLGPLPAATLLRVVRLRGILVVASTMAV